MSDDNDDLDDLKPQPSSVDSFLDELEKEIDNEIAAESSQPEAGAEQAPAAEDSTGSKPDGAPQPRKDEEGGQGAGSPQEVAPRSGAERRLWEERNILRAERANLLNTTNQLRQNLEQARAELAATREAMQSVAGADPQTVSRAVNLWNQLQSNPTATIQQLLTEAAAAGIKVAEAGQAVDTAALIERKVQEALAPLLKPLQEQELANQRQEQANQVYDAFIAQYPDAEIQAEAIGALLERDPRLSLDGAYYQLKLAFAQNGLDWTIPLAEQLKKPNHASEVKAPMVSGRTAPVAPMVPANRTTVAPASKSYNDIVREVLREHGIGS